MRPTLADANYMNVTLQTDAYSANTALGATHWSSFHTFRCEWRSGPDGYMRWSLDGKLQYQLRGSMLHTPRELSVNGTALGTRLLADLCPGQCSSLDSAPNFHVEGSSLFFAANDGQHGRELWRLDAAAGSQPVMALDLNPRGG